MNKYLTHSYSCSCSRSRSRSIAGDNAISILCPFHYRQPPPHRRSSTTAHTMAAATNAFSNWCTSLFAFTSFPHMSHAMRGADGRPRQTTARSGIDRGSCRSLLYSLVLRRTQEMGEPPLRPLLSTWGTSSRMTPPSSTPSSPRSTKHSSDLLLDPSIMDPLGLTTARLKTPRMSSPKKPSRHGSQRARRSVLYVMSTILVGSRRWIQSPVRCFSPQDLATVWPMRNQLTNVRCRSRTSASPCEQLWRHSDSGPTPAPHPCILTFALISLLSLPPLCRP